MVGAQNIGSKQIDFFEIKINNQKELSDLISRICLNFGHRRILGLIK